MAENDRTAANQATTTQMRVLTSLGNDLIANVVYTGSRNNPTRRSIPLVADLEWARVRLTSDSESCGTDSRSGLSEGLAERLDYAAPNSRKSPISTEAYFVLSGRY